MPLPNYTTALAAPVPAQQGDLWFNPSTSQLNVFNGVMFIPLTHSSIGAAANASSVANAPFLPIPTVTGSYGATLSMPPGTAGLIYDATNHRMWMVASGGVWKSAAFA